MYQEGAPRESLVKYDTPLELGRSVAGSKMNSSDPVKLQTSIKAQVNKKVDIPYAGAKPTTDDILHTILPPREWVENDKHFIQYVSSTPATRKDVTALSTDLQTLLMQRQARETGICPVREELYAQCFDELIRQVTIDCPERGLLLLRARDEIRMTIAAYQTLYHSSVTFGTRKQLQAEMGKAETEELISDLKDERSQLEGRVAQLKAQVENIKRRSEETRAYESRKRQEEIDFLQHQSAHLDTFLKGADAAAIN